ncbi:MAG: CBS domain-containing protein, partial [Burkholderiales bacterium]|nr:CBS domain-containing protein [Burkholderiales bacterium]
MELMRAEEVAGLLAAQPPHAVVPVWEQLASDVEQSVIELLPDDMVRHLLTELEPALAVALLVRLEPEPRQHCLALLDPQVVAELKKLMDYPPDSAGQLMDPRVVTLRSEFTVHEALTRLRTLKRRDVHEIFLVDNAGHLEGRVQIQDLAMAEPDLMLQRLRRKITGVVTDVAPREEVVELLERSDITDLPVVDFSGRLVGVIRQSALVSAVQEEASIDMLTMVGASKDERALSRVGFAVKKRLPWLQINLLTAFLAASVVGLFEGTIAKFTALAVLLPVVAGQSGNAGAQALAVTMRGLVLREISLRHWPKVVFKEIGVGFLNGLAIAATT